MGGGGLIPSFPVPILSPDPLIGTINGEHIGTAKDAVQASVLQVGNRMPHFKNTKITKFDNSKNWQIQKLTITKIDKIVT